MLDLRAHRHLQPLLAMNMWPEAPAAVQQALQEAASFAELLHASAAAGFDVLAPSQWQAPSESASTSMVRAKRIMTALLERAGTPSA